MLNKEQLQEIREWLEKAQNPLFFFDNDVDGLISFLLLQRFIERGKGIPIKSFPELNKSYARKISELKPDVIFILDKPLVDAAFFEEARVQNIPVIWIDHHPLQKIEEGVYYYNPLQGENISSEPVSYWCFNITKKDLWLAMIGCIADWFVPDFIDEFRKRYPELIESKKSAPEILYETQLGKLVTIFGFALKDTTSNVVKMLKILEKAKDPYEILSGEKKYEYILKRSEYLNKKFEAIFEKADEIAKKANKLVFFQYAGNIKFSAELANKLIYKYPGKIIAVAGIQGDKVNISLRGKMVRMLLEKALENVEGRGGGHEAAAAATIQVKNLKKFIEEIRKQL
ncbi:MAG: DHHA1 domain-containing protein [Candidatus Pacearchaeota archaeon]